MSDTTYNVRTVYTADTRQATGAIDRLGALFSRLGGLLAGLKSLLLGLPALIAAAFATGAVGAFLARVMAVGSAAQTTRLALAGMINAQMFATAARPAGDFGRALAATDAVVQRMRVHARDLPGTFEDLQTVFQGGLSGGINAGQTLGQIEQLSARLMSVTKSFGIDSEQVGRDFTLMLSGRAGAQVNTFARLQPLIGKTAEEFNRMSAPQRWEAISRALNGFDPMIEAYSRSWDAVSSTAQDHLQNLFRVGSAPLFTRVTSSVSRLNDWFERHQTQLTAIATLVGTRLADAWGRVEASIARLPGLFERVVSSPAFARLGSFGGALGDRLAQLTGGAGPSGAAVATGAGVAASVATGVPGIGLVLGALLAFGTHTEALSSVMSSLGTIGATVVAILGTLWTALVGLEGALGTILAATLPGVSAGFGSMLTGFSGGLTSLLGGIGSIITALTPLLTFVGAIVGEVASKIGVLLGGAIEILAGRFEQLARLTSSVVIGMTNFVRQVGGHILNNESVRAAGRGVRDFAALNWGLATLPVRMAATMGGNMLRAMGVAGGHRAGAQMRSSERPMMVRGADGTLRRVMQRVQTPDRGFFDESTTRDMLMRGWVQGDRFLRAGTATPSGRRAAGGATGPDLLGQLQAALARVTTTAQTNAQAQIDALNQRLANGRNVPSRGNTNVTNHVQVHQTIEQADDPDRVLIATRDGVIDAMLHPIESRTAVVTR